MWAWAMVTVAALVVTPLFALRDEGEHRVQDAQSRARAERMAVLRSAAKAWAHAHPGFDGPLDAGALGTPAWWRGGDGLHALVHGRIVAVYASGPDAPVVLQQMLALSNGSIWVGTAEHGTLHSPTLGDTGIAVPSAVPEQAPVWLALRD